VKVVTGVPPGSVLDALARTLAEVLKGNYAVNAMVDNRIGASGILAISTVRSAPRDGSTILVTPSAPITIFPVTYKKLAYNPDTDLMPVSTLTTFDLALAVGPMVPASVTNLREYFSWCKANPKQASFASPGTGSMPHFIGTMTGRLAKIDLQHVPYRGPSAAMTDMLGGTVSAAVVLLGDATEFALNGKCRILGTTGSTRSRYSPEVPTFAEQGFGEYALSGWVGAFLPAGTPPAMVQKLNAVLKTMLSDKVVVAELEHSAQDAHWCTPEELAARIQAERASWSKVVKAMNFTADT
jgi:tripartite-type tricarboxylate transporter receptor subunit TctC